MGEEFHHGAAGGLLELRREGNGSVRLAGSFPYRSPAVLSDGGRSGRPVKEVIEPEAFNYAIAEPETEIHLLIGHDFNRPLASKRAGTLTFRDTPAALTFLAIIVPAIAGSVYGSDALAQVEAGLIAGISPGFRLPPERAVPREEAEVVEEEVDDPSRGMHRAVIRRIRQAILAEFSLVARPAYPATTIEAARRADLIRPPASAALLARRRWRA